ncbi:MAG: hypothetical protein ACRD6X_22250 [Pyrinomonadaceae bacterium]
MFTFSRSIFLVVIFGSIFISSCSSNRNSNDNIQSAPNANSNIGNSTDPTKTTNDNIEELRTIIIVPFEPDEVVWRVFKGTGSEDRLVAVFRLMKNDAESFSSKVSANVADVAAVSVEDWFPAELKAMGETTGESNISCSVLPAAEFVQEPYSNGTVYVVPDSGYIVVELRTNKK